MRSVHKYYMVGCLAVTLVLMVLGPGNQARAQTILFDSFDSYIDMFGMYPDQAAFETNWPIDGSCLGYVVSNDFSRQNSVPNSLRQDMGGPGTLMVKDISAGAGSSSPTDLGSLSDVPCVHCGPDRHELFFAADDGVNGVELWKNIGFLYTNTTLVKDINPGPGSSSPANMTDGGNFDVDGTLYFTADDGSNGVELWVTDGSTAGTVMVKDINPGATGSSPSDLIVLEVSTDVYVLYFTADDGTNGRELWKSDGTAAGTVMVKDINPGASGSSPSNLAMAMLALDQYVLYFTADNGTNGVELWKSNGTVAGTVMVKDINPGAGSSSPSELTDIENALLMFAADDGTNGRELWSSDGTGAYTAMVKDINAGASGSTPANLVYFNSLLYFTADDGTNGNELWKSNGSTAGTVMVKDINPGAGSSSPAELTGNELYYMPAAGTLFFTADDGSVGRELWKTTGTGASTVLVKDIKSGLPGSSPSNLVMIGVNQKYPMGTTPGMGSAAARARVMFSADDGISGNELWRSDGTTAGTVMVKDIVPGPTGSSPANLYGAYWPMVGTMLFFSADDGTNGHELWQSDGTEAGIVGAGNKQDLVPLIQALDPTKLAVIGTDANPFVVWAGFDLPTFGGDNQLSRQSTLILEVTDGVDRAPVGPISMVDCGGGVSRPQIPMTDGTTHNAFAIGVIAQLDPNPCDTDPIVPDFPQVPVVAQVVVYDGAEWHICAAGKFGLTEDALVGKRWNWCSANIKTNTIDVSWRCKQCADDGPTWSFTVPRQYLGGFKAVHLGDQGCVKSQFDSYFEDVMLSGGKLVSSIDPTLGACCFDHTTCTDNTTSEDCATAGGEWQGSFSECAGLSCCGDPFADYDYDGDVDQVDFGIFQACYTGDGGTIPDTPPECDCFDRHPAGGDGDVDVDDFTAFETCWSGPTVPAVQSCDD